MKTQFIFTIASVFMLWSCENAFVPDDPSTDNEAIFNQAWSFVNENYSFFEDKNIDWNSIKNEYETLAIEAQSEEALFDVLSDMLYELRDGHVNLYSPFNVSRNWDWYLNAPPNYDRDILQRNYFKDQQQYIGPFTVMDFDSIKVVYMYYGAFTSIFSAGNLNYIFEKYADYNGVILDIRNNGGGLVANAEALARRVPYDSETTLAFEQKKTGAEYDNFSELEPITIESNDLMKFPGQLVLLTNRRSYSASNMCATYMRALNVPIVGDSSGGGGGLPVSTELSNGWTLRCSATRLYSPDMINVEFGVPPTISVDFNDSSIVNGVDPILERALRLINEGN